ncbi:MAG: SDR family oxidoreductase [Saprospiraceae bacterium]|nr:SDR family oxidoreductase [Saprospiraceae bacterium]
MKAKRKALVTGAARGIGLAIAERLVEDGYFVIAIDRDEEAGSALRKRWDAGTLAFEGLDVSEEEGVRQFFGNFEGRYGALDVLVNNAGIIRDNFITNMPTEDFDAVIRVNLRSAWLMCREAANIMRKQNSGRIINIASRAWLGNPGQSNYAASKAGLIGLTRVLALELGKFNVLVNAVAPGLIDTDLTRKLKAEVLQRLIEMQPTRSMGKPADVANAVAFLASPDTGFITGQVIYVDGGRSIGAAV